ncbi:MAG: hypothetical protein EXR71_13610 [Myxococcales bacterium]|nr:hypothetical protein [Myxococcales bacterium]
MLLALGRAARSFLIYEPTNEAIRIFLDNLRRTTDAFLSLYGELDLDVRPFELVHAAEVVYLDRDRERSLAFRLYRDGIRRVVLRPGLDWHELLKLLEVVSIRYIGVRQTEDDLVVLLWKAGFTHISFDAVEGFVADTETSETDDAVGESGEGAEIDAPPDFDLPVPLRPTLVRVFLREVPRPALDELLREDDTTAVPEMAVRLCEDLLAVLGDPVDPLRFEDVAPHLIETREFLFAEGLVPLTVRLAYAAATAQLHDEASDRACGSFLEGFVTATAIGRFLHSVSRDATEAPHELYALLDALPGDHLRTLVDVLRRETGEAPRRITRRLIEHYVADRADELVQWLDEAPTALACELLRVLRYVDTDRALAAAQRLTARGDLTMQLEVLHTLEALPDSGEVSRLLLGLTAADNDEVRTRALAMLGRRGSTAAFAPLLQRLKRDATLRLRDREAEALGEALAALNGTEALSQFREWCKPKGFFGAVAPGIARLQRAAVAGLVHIHSDDAEALIKAVHEGAGSDLQGYCQQAMIRRRRIARGGPG